MAGAAVTRLAPGDRAVAPAAYACCADARKWTAGRPSAARPRVRRSANDAGGIGRNLCDNRPAATGRFHGSQDMRMNIWWAAGLLAAASMLSVSTARAGDISCKMTFQLSGWSVFYKTARGTGTVRCSNGQSLQVKLRAKGGGLTFGKTKITDRSEEHTSELQSHVNLVCRLLLEKKK